MWCCYSQFRILSAFESYTTEWQHAWVGIPTGCPISPIIFLMRMEVVIRHVSRSIPDASLKDGIKLSSIGAYMDDPTMVTDPSEQKHPRKVPRLLTEVGLHCKSGRLKLPAQRWGIQKKDRYRVSGKRKASLEHC